jgi:hypothetical protein
MNNAKKRILLIFSVVALSAAAAFAANLANPAAQAGDARMVFGASYYLGGADITRLNIPMMMNRISARVTYSPIRYVNFGLDGGTTHISVDKFPLPGAALNPDPDVPDSARVFKGNLGWSGGAHLKLTTPYLFDYVGLVAIGHVNYFYGVNDLDARYAGTNFVAAAGLQVRIPRVGAVSLGPQFYLINGRNRSYDGVEAEYSNVNNVRAWVAFDYFPEMEQFTGNHKPYISVEFTASPKIGGSSRVPIREFSVSVSIGAITQRLYGELNDADMDFY